MKAPIERTNRIWPTEKLATSHLPMASLSENMNRPTSMMITPAAAVFDEVSRLLNPLMVVSS